VRWVGPLLLSGCGLVLDLAPGSDAEVGPAHDASADVRARDASPLDGGPTDGAFDARAPDGEVAGVDAADTCAVSTTLHAEAFEGPADLDARGWTTWVEVPPFAARMSDPEGDGPGSGGGRYLILETTDGNVATAESAGAASPWLAVPACGGGELRVSVHAVAGDVEFAREGETFDLTVESRTGEALGILSFDDQDERNIGRPGALWTGHTLLTAEDWVSYERMWPLPPGATQVRVSVRLRVSHWDDFGGIDELVVTYVPPP
jgi:hypothetical protein